VFTVACPIPLEQMIDLHNVARIQEAVRVGLVLWVFQLVELVKQYYAYCVLISTALLPRFGNRRIILISRHHEIATDILCTYM
jgi:hypothetical protein